MPKSAWNAKRKTARTVKRQSKRAKTKAQHRHTEVPRNQRDRRGSAPINFWAGKLSSLFDVKPKGKAA